MLRRFIFGKPVQTILFVGERNTDASAVCELLLNHYAEQGRAEGKPPVRAASAGMWAEEGAEISSRAGSYLASKGIDASGFRSRRFSAEMCDANQLTLTLDMGVKGMLLFRKPEAVIYTLSEYSLMGADITKAWELGDEAYASTMAEIDEMITRSYKRASRNVTF